MTLKKLSALENLEHWLSISERELKGISRDLQNPGKEWSPEFADVIKTLLACRESVQALSDKAEVLFDSDEISRSYADLSPLSDAEISQLLGLNRRLSDLNCHLQSVVDDVTPQLDAKLADSNDPMVDYEIEARFAYVLREDDPEYDEDDDNILATRTESIKHQELREPEDFTQSIEPAGLRAEPHCWFFHDLHDHHYGVTDRRLSLQDCLRIGSVWVDVQVWQQYDFKVPAR